MKGLLFTYTLAYGGTFVSLFNPFWGLLAYICFAIIRPESLWHWSVPAGNYSRIVAIGLLAGWIAKGCGDWNFGSARPIAFALLGYWACIVASAIFAANQQVAWDYVILHSKILLPVLVGLTLVDSEKRLRAVAWVIVGSLGFLAFEGNLDHFLGGYRVRFDGMGGMDNNSFCIAMVLGTGVAFFLGLAEKNLWLKWVAFAAAGLMAHVPMFGNSRGGMLALCVLGAVSFILIPKRPAHVAALALGFVIALRLAGPAVWERFETIFSAPEDRDDSAQSRLDLWADGWDVMKTYPMTGAGPDHWPLLAHTYGWPPGKEIHSLWVNAGAELGFLGLTFLSGMYLITLWKSGRFALSRHGDGDWTLHTARMTAAGLAAFMVAASFVSLDALEPPYHLLILGGGALRTNDIATFGFATNQTWTQEHSQQFQVEIA